LTYKPVQPSFKPFKLKKLSTKWEKMGNCGEKWEIIFTFTIQSIAT